MFFTVKRFLKSEYAERINSQDQKNLALLAKVFPFKVSRYVLDELIDWRNYDDDPVYRLTFPRKSMLSDRHWNMMENLSSVEEEKKVVNLIRHSLNPHPNGQKKNIPKIGDRSFGGLQHKYRETVLFFPAQGQTCHSYCTYCFRWAQFVNLDEHKFKSKDHKDLYDYLLVNPDVTDVLITGGDPLFMPNKTLFSYLDVLTMPELSHIRSIRLGSKSLSFYPNRFLGEEGDEIIYKLKQIIKSGKHIAFMAHFSHPNELSTEKVTRAVERLRNAGVEIRSQAPLIKGINDNPETWRDMWQKQVEMGIIPYYMFVERDTGAHNYFSVPLFRAYEIFTEAYSQISGLAKTVRGPSMSADPGKVLIDGIVEYEGAKHFVLKFIQARDASQINKPFFAKFNENATWLDELEIEEDLSDNSVKADGYFSLPQNIYFNS
ncbi:MAG: lysine 2,3-aminomutase [Calditrichae bacterium]|nr:lysine 2,3-aminomutase [Calditrichota bacterium]MCB9057333.1 lysine 2,3-aminomutase [Calditrichia bacterium]